MTKHRRSNFAVGGGANKDIQRFEAEFYSGVVPHPDLARSWNALVPGAAERFLIIAESQQRHRQGLESTVVRSNIFNERVAMILAFVLCMTIVISGVLLLWNGKTIGGLASIITPLGGLIYVYRQGRKKQAEDLEKKRERVDAERNRR